MPALLGPPRARPGSCRDWSGHPPRPAPATCKALAPESSQAFQTPRLPGQIPERGRVNRPSRDSGAKSLPRSHCQAVARGGGHRAEGACRAWGARGRSTGGRGCAAGHAEECSPQPAGVPAADSQGTLRPTALPHSASCARTSASQNFVSKMPNIPPSLPKQLCLSEIYAQTTLQSLSSTSSFPSLAWDSCRVVSGRGEVGRTPPTWGGPACPPRPTALGRQQPPTVPTVHETRQPQALTCSTAHTPGRKLVRRGRGMEHADVVGRQELHEPGTVEGIPFTVKDGGNLVRDVQDFPGGQGHGRSKHTLQGRRSCVRTGCPSLRGTDLGGSGEASGLSPSHLGPQPQTSASPSPTQGAAGWGGGRCPLGS